MNRTLDGPDYYEIYQLSNPDTCLYAFHSYNHAREIISREDYRYVCTGHVQAEDTLGSLAQKYPVSVSDIMVVKRDHKYAVYYTNHFGFYELIGPTEKDIYSI